MENIVLDKKTGEHVRIEYRALILQQLKNYFACHNDCNSYCNEFLKTEIIKQDGRKEVRKICDVDVLRN